jgi:hypothetical protein|tara:strand:+ start:6804 stop:7664 length:861 start_codon:yes stop_codon:yes gene_type:complete
VNIKNLLAELKSDFSRDFASGLIDDSSVKRWSMNALKKFGENLMVVQEATVEVSNGKGTLPSNFHSLYAAVLCNPRCYNKISGESKVFESNIWVETTEKSIIWDSCDGSCTTESEKTVTEQVIVDDCVIEKHYTNPTLLRLGKNIKRGDCGTGCLNNVNTPCNNEITINNRTLNTNFKEGTVFIQYYGLELDDCDFPIVNTDKGEVETYVEYHIKRRLMENKLSNGDDYSGGNLLSYFRQEERDSFSLALTAIKFETLTPDTFRRFKARNKMDMLKFEYLTRNPYT